MNSGRSQPYYRMKSRAGAHLCRTGDARRGASGTGTARGRAPGAGAESRSRRDRDQGTAGGGDASQPHERGAHRNCSRRAIWHRSTGSSALITDLHPLIDEILGEPHARTPHEPARSGPTAHRLSMQRPSPAGLLDRQGDRERCSCLGNGAVEQADRALDGHQRRDREVAHEESLCEAQCGLAQARGRTGRGCSAC